MAILSAIIRRMCPNQHRLFSSNFSSHWRILLPMLYLLFSLYLTYSPSTDFSVLYLIPVTVINMGRNFDLCAKYFIAICTCPFLPKDTSSLPNFHLYSLIFALIRCKVLKLLCSLGFTNQSSSVLIISVFHRLSYSHSVLFLRSRSL